MTISINDKIAAKYPLLTSMNITINETFLGLNSMTLRLRQADLAQHLEKVVAELRRAVANPDSVKVIHVFKVYYVVVDDVLVLRYQRNWLRRWVYHTDIYGKNIKLAMAPIPEVEAAREAAGNAMMDLIFGIGGAILSAGRKAPTKQDHPVALLDNSSK